MCSSVKRRHQLLLWPASGLQALLKFAAWDKQSNSSAPTAGDPRRRDVH